MIAAGASAGTVHRAWPITSGTTRRSRRACDGARRRREHRRPEPRAAAAEPRSSGRARVRGDLVRGGATPGELDLAGALERPEPEERLGDRPAAREQPVVAQDHQRVVAKAFDKPRLLVLVVADPLELVVADRAVELCRIEVVRVESALERGDGAAGRRVRVHDHVGVRPARVDRRVDQGARRVHPPGVGINGVAVEVDRHEVCRGHLAVGEAERINQQPGLVARQPERDVIEDHLGPPEKVEDPVAGGQLDAVLPLLGAHPRGPIVVDAPLLQVKTHRIVPLS